MKICNKCDKTKFYEEYHKCRVMKDGYNNTCKECLNAMNRRYVKKHIEGDLLYQSKRYKKYRANVDPEKYKADKSRAERKWRMANPGIFRERNRLRAKNRKALKKNAIGKVTSTQLNKLIEDSNNICFWCDKEIDVMHLDHIYPLTKYRDHSISNLCVSCADCNRRKHDKDPEIFLEEILTEKA